MQEQGGSVLAEDNGQGAVVGMGSATPEAGISPPGSVFISYASADAAVADSVVASLESHGVGCWIAPRDVRAGALYAEAIVRAISDAKALVLVLSANSVASAHVGKEVERASSKRRPIIALRIDEAPLSPALEYFLSESHWIDARADDIGAATRKLIGALQEPERPAPAGATNGHPGARAVTAAAAHLKSRDRILVAAGLALLILAVTALLVERWATKHAGAVAQSATVAADIVGDKSIAVLPFEDMSEKKDQEYFADGIAEEVLDRLAQVPGLKVVGRASSFQFKGRSADLASVGAALGVAYLLEGSVRKEADRVRVAAQLVEARTGAQRWSNHFDSDSIDVLQVQDAIAAELARALQLAIEVNTTPRTAIRSSEALDTYLRGLQSLDLSSQEGCETAVAQFQQSLALDPTFAPAASGLARALTWIGAEGWQPPRVVYERAREAALLAQKLDPKSPQPHVVMANIHILYDWDWVGADRELQQAAALGPRDTFWFQTAGFLAGALGHWDEARQFNVEAITLDPLSPDPQEDIGFTVYLRTGNFAEAERYFRRALQISPEYGAGHYFLGVALLLQGHNEAALAEFQKETEEDGRLEGTAMVYFAAGRRVESNAQLAEAIRKNATDWPSAIARVYAFRGERDTAFEWLNRAYEARDEDLYYVRGDPLLKNLEGDLRYKPFLRKMNLTE
jgi:TolB-like protein/Tfp pilus assembly protein PilF